MLVLTVALQFVVQRLQESFNWRVHREQLLTAEHSAHLILDEGHQGRDDNGDPLEQYRRQLVAQALPCTCTRSSVISHHNAGQWL